MESIVTPDQLAALESTWAQSDSYHNSFLLPQDPAFSFAIVNSKKQGIPAIAVSAAQGRFLNLIAKTINAKNILEIGTLAGYSTIWLVAQQNIDNAGLTDKVEIRVGPAADTLKAMEPDVPFDLVFIDADKNNNVTYFVEAKRLTRKGSVIIVDNVVRIGSDESFVADTTKTNKVVEGVRALLKYIHEDPEVEATTISTVGEKGYDGFTYVLRK